VFKELYSGVIISIVSNVLWTCHRYRPHLSVSYVSSTYQSTGTQVFVLLYSTRELDEWYVQLQTGWEAIIVYFTLEIILAQNVKRKWQNNIQVYQKIKTTVLGFVLVYLFYSAGNEPMGLVHASQEFYPSHTPQPKAAVLKVTGSDGGSFKKWNSLWDNTNYFHFGV
jgi:hypothetical protein